MSLDEAGAVNYASNNGVVLVAAAANNCSQPLMYPASSRECHWCCGDRLVRQSCRLLERRADRFDVRSVLVAK